jgi:hypothetical protein
MTDVQAAASPAASGPGLFSRLVGVIFSPRATYQAIATNPRALGALVVTIGLGCVIQFVFLSTEVGQNAMFDQQIEGMERFGIEVTDEAMQRMEEGLPRLRYTTPLFQIPAGVIFGAILSGLLVVTLNAFLDGDAKFKQVFAIAAHAGGIVTLQQLFAAPINYARGEIGAPASLGVFLPMLDPDGFLAGLLGAIDLFFVWWIISLAIGLGVLYKRPTGGIATSLLCVYVVIAFIIALF